MTTRNVPEHLNQSHDGKSKGERHLLMEQDVNVSHALCYKLSFGHIFILTIKNIFTFVRLIRQNIQMLPQNVLGHLFIKFKLNSASFVCRKLQRFIYRNSNSSSLSLKLQICR